MSFLRSLRNLAVLVIVTVAGLSFSPHSVAAQSSCRPLGASCSSGVQCCSRMCFGHCCDKGFRGMGCNSSAECCSGFCLNHMCI
jgi:hypothetical protein